MELQEKKNFMREALKERRKPTTKEVLPGRLLGTNTVGHNLRERTKTPPLHAEIKKRFAKQTSTLKVATEDRETRHAGIRPMCSGAISRAALKSKATYALDQKLGQQAPFYEPPLKTSVRTIKSKSSKVS